MRGRGIRLVVVAWASILMLATLAACSSSKAGTTSGPSGAASSKSAIVIGNIGSYTGPESASIGPAESVIKAWATDLNANGGINGHPVKLIVLDDGGNPTTALSDAKELVQDNVVAIVGEISLVDTAWASVAEAAGVPVIGGQPFTDPFLTNADFFPSGSNGLARTYGEVAAAKNLGGKFDFLYCVESPVCAQAVPEYKLFASDLGITIPVTQSISGSAPSYTAPCLAVKNSGAQSYQVAEADSVALRIAEACSAEGVTAKFIGTAGVIGPDWLPVPSTAGDVNIDLDIPFFVDSTPATKAYHALLTKYSLGDSSGADGTYGYIGAQLFEAAAKAVPAGAAVTSQSLKTALYAMKGETLGGLTPPLTFKKGAPTLINCWYVDTIENKQWTTPEGLTPACAPAASIAAAAVKILGS